MVLILFGEKSLLRVVSKVDWVPWGLVMDSLFCDIVLFLLDAIL